jgi:hypothetical protein
MERHDDVHEAPDEAGRDTADKHPAQPVQPDSGYAEGVEEKPDAPEEALEPDFARGVREGPESDVEERPRFSEGIEQTPDTPDKTVERRFSEGIERSPTSE